MKNLNLNKFVDKDNNVWEIIRKNNEIILRKDGENLVFFMDDQTGNRLLRNKIKKLRG